MRARSVLEEVQIINTNGIETPCSPKQNSRLEPQPRQAREQSQKQRRYLMPSTSSITKHNCYKALINNKLDI